jgi:hypothetical protein
MGMVNGDQRASLVVGSTGTLANAARRVAKGIRSDAMLTRKLATFVRTFMVNIASRHTRAPTLPLRVRSIAHTITMLSALGSTVGKAARTLPRPVPRHGANVPTLEASVPSFGTTIRKHAMPCRSERKHGMSLLAPGYRRLQHAGAVRARLRIV